MSNPPKSTRKTPIDGIAFITTAYRCQNCCHWNNLKLRNGFKEWKEAQINRTNGEAR